MTEADPMENHPMEFVILMALLMSIVAISIDAMLPALGIIADDLQLANPNHAQYLIGGIFIGMAAGQLVCGPLSDALGRKKILYFGLGLYLIGGLVCYFANSLDVLLAGRVVQGLGVAGPYVSVMSIVRDKFAGRAMARIMSLVMVIFMIVPALAPSIGQGIMMLSSWKGIFVFYIGYAIVAGSWITLRLEETLPKEKRIPFHTKNIMDGFKEVFRTRTTICYMICMGICFGSLIGYLNSSQQIFQDQFGTGKMFTVYFGCLAAVLAVSSLMNSRLVEKLGMRYICTRAFLAMCVSAGVFLAMHAFVEIELWMFLAFAAVLFFCFGLVFGNLNALAMEPMGHIAGIASAIIGSTSSFMSLTIGTVIGQFYNGTLVPVAAGFFVLNAVALVFMKLAERH